MHRQEPEPVAPDVSNPVPVAAIRDPITGLHGSAENAAISNPQREPLEKPALTAVFRKYNRHAARRPKGDDPLPGPRLARGIFPG